MDKKCLTSGPPLPARPGTYVLLLRNSTQICLEIGSLGRCVFPKGWYLYVGSAFGPGGLPLSGTPSPMWDPAIFEPVQSNRPEPCPMLYESIYSSGWARSEPASKVSHT